MRAVLSVAPGFKGTHTPAASTSAPVRVGVLLGRPPTYLTTTEPLSRLPQHHSGHRRMVQAPLTHKAPRGLWRAGRGSMSPCEAVCVFQSEWTQAASFVFLPCAPRQSVSGAQGEPSRHLGSFECLAATSLCVPKTVTGGNPWRVSVIMAVFTHYGDPACPPWWLSPIMAKRFEWYTGRCRSLHWSRLGR